MMQCRDYHVDKPNPYYKDGFCQAHWDEHFAGMTNRERMLEKKRLRKIRKGITNEKE